MQQKLHHNRAGANYDAFVLKSWWLESKQTLNWIRQDFDQDNFIITDDELEEEEPNEAAHEKRQTTTNGIESR